MSLQSQQKKALDQASRSQIESALSRLRGQWFGGNEWLPNNRYLHDTAQKIKDDKSADQLSFPDLIDYIAASTLAHCFEGWSFLARALEAELSGDPDIARHLGYYAELRAACSILAGQGIGVFNTNHVVVLDNGNCEILSKIGTHELVWKALEYWANSSRSTDILLQAIRPANIPLQQWLNSFGGSSQTVAYGWLQEWGLDLSRLEQDRKARNISSYRANAFITPGPKTINETLSTVIDLWNMCSPGSSGGFSQLDRHLLRQSVNKIFKPLPGEHAVQKQQRYKDRIAKMLNAQSLSGPERDLLQKFLCFEYDRNPPRVLSAANRNDQPNHPDHSQQVIARAMLLLRVATGSLSILLHDSGVDFRKDLKFWWSTPSIRRRLWHKNKAPDGFDDLWDDVNDALYDAEVAVQPPNHPDCHYSFWFAHTNSANSPSILSTSERIFLWGV